MTRLRARPNQLRRFAVWSGKSLPLVAALLAGCDLPGRPNSADRAEAQRHLSSFDSLYKTHCSGCHGASGKLGPAPPLNDQVFLAIAPDAELLRVIREGRPGTPMPAFARDKGGPLTEVQVKTLAETIKPRWRSNQPGKVALPTYTVERGDKARGAGVFGRACAHCHGENGEGGENAGQEIGAINDTAFLALVSAQALRRYVITGRPDLGMPDYAGDDGRAENYQPLSGTEIADLVALLSSWRQSTSANAE